MLRIAAMVALLVLAGCGTMTPTTELERQAFLTGDWSAVEARERMQVRRAMRHGMQCPTGHMGFCQDYLGSERCSCVQRDTVRIYLTSR